MGSGPRWRCVARCWPCGTASWARRPSRPSFRGTTRSIYLPSSAPPAASKWPTDDSGAVGTSLFVKACRSPSLLLASAYCQDNMGALKIKHTSFMLRLWRMLFCQPLLSSLALSVLFRNHW